MRIDLEEGYLIIVHSPSSCSDDLTITIAENNTSKAMVSLDANATAKLIGALKSAFLGFAGLREG